MKVFLSLVALVIVSLSNLQAQTTLSEPNQGNIIIVVNTASWCPACIKNGSSVENEVIPSNIGNSKYTIVVNDLSNEESIKKSIKVIEANGLTDLLKKNKTTGMILLVDAKSKGIVSKISVKESSDKIKQVIANAVAKN